MAITINGTTGITFPNALTQDQAVASAGSAPLYACRAWVNFNGTGTIAIRSSANVSSLVDNGVGDYTVNFGIAMLDANYAVAGAVARGASNSRGAGFEVHPSTAQTTTSVTVRGITIDTSPAPLDCGSVDVCIFR